VTVVEQKFVILISRQRLPKLLQRPLCGRMFGRIEMHQAQRPDLQCNEHIKHAKGGGNSSEAITSYDSFGVIFQEGGPALVSRSARSGRLLDVFGEPLGAAGNPGACKWDRCTVDILDRSRGGYRGGGRGTSPNRLCQISCSASISAIREKW